jgi:phosphonate transport system substrate-binding protein
MILSAGLYFLSLTLPASTVQSKSDIQKERVVLKVGYPTSAFSKGIEKDIEVALEVWGSRLAEKATERIKKVNSILFEDEYFSAIYDALKRKEIDLLIMNSLDYIDFEQTKFMEPVFIGLSGENVGHRYVLLVRRDSGIRSLLQLNNGTINIETEGVGRMPIVWLEVLLRREGFSDVQTFFRASHFLDKTSETVLPVFFNKITACVTKLGAYRTMTELNPQLEKELVVINESPELLRGLVIFRTDLDMDLKNTITDALLTMHEDVDGQQILMIMREQRLIPFKPEYIDTARTLYQEYKQLQQKIK